MKIVPEPDRLDARVPLGILAVSIVTLALGAVLTLGVRAFSEVELRASTSAASARQAGPRPFAIEVAAAQPSGLFGRHTAAAPTRQLPERLREYGWVDRERGVVRIPIERAKQLYLARKAGVTQPVSHQEPGSP